MSFLDVIFENLAAHPSRPFVTEVHGERLERAYGGRLRELAGSGRSALRAVGVGKGDRVALLAPNSIRWVAADLAILAEGAIVVPLYARQAPNELVQMMKDAGVRLVVCADDALAGAVCALWDGAPTITFDAFFGAEPITDEKPRPRAPDDVVTLIYTSGTSGEPKGVMTTAGNVDFMLPVIDGRLTELMGRPGGRDRVFHYLPFCFAGSRFVLWSNLYRANGVMVSTQLEDLQRELGTASPEWFLNVPALLERIRTGVETKLRERGRAIWALYQAASKAWRAERAGRASIAERLLLTAARRILLKRIRAQIGQLECLICGSAPLTPETQAFFELLDLPVYQVYGLTETTAIVTMDRPHDALGGSVGFAIEGCDIKLGPGDELLVKGPNVFAGYWNKEEATRDAFTDDGWFKTGDQAAIDARGRVSIVGRVKNILVPESGHNVAPEPIEARLMEHVPNVAQAVVVGHGRPFLTAILTGTTDRDAVERAVDAINRELPHYRRIRAFHLSEEPFTIESGLLTANQKLRRSAIEAHYADAIARLYA